MMNILNTIVADSLINPPSLQWGKDKMKKVRRKKLPTRKELANAMFNGTTLDLPLCYDAVDFMIERKYIKVDLSIE